MGPLRPIDILVDAEQRHQLLEQLRQLELILGQRQVGRQFGLEEQLVQPGQGLGCEAHQPSLTAQQLL